MDKKDYIIVGLVLFVAVAISVIATYHFTKSDIELKYNTRNDSLESANVILTGREQRLQLEVRELNQMILINEIGTEQNKVIYKNKVSQIKKQNSNEDYKDVIDYLNSYNLH